MWNSTLQNRHFYNYRGWRLAGDDRNGHPVTGRWTALRYGVEMCAGTEKAIKQMVDQRHIDYPGGCGDWAQLFDDTRTKVN